MNSSKKKTTSIVIKPLEYFEVLASVDQIEGAVSADTYANAYAIGNTAYANAGAVALGSLSVAQAKTKTHVKAGNFYTVGVSYAVAYAVGYDGVNADASASASADVGISKNY